MKRCSTCKVSKPRAEFYERVAAPDGLNYNCKTCTKTYTRQWGRQNKRNRKEHSLRYEKANPIKRMLGAAKRRAAHLGRGFSLTEEDVSLPVFCPVFGILLRTHQRDGRGGKPDSYSLDRIDNTKGYVKGNVQIISHRANALKSDATPEELLLFTNWVLKTYGKVQT